MVYDCFPFFNELDVLELRLNILDPVVDKFVLVEATKTHAGADKPLYFAENRERYAKWADKIIYVKIDDYPPFFNSWTYENWQRNCIDRGLKDCKDDDVILISDADEIPNPDIVKKYAGSGRALILEQLSFSYYLDCMDTKNTIWGFGTRMVTYHQFKHYFDHRFRLKYDEGFLKELNKGTTATKFRSYGHLWSVRRGGWHFSYLGGAEAVAKKLKSFSHQEYNKPEYTDPKLIEERIRAGKDLFDDEVHYHAVKLNEAMPKHLVENREKYDKFLLGNGDLDAGSYWKDPTIWENISQMIELARHII